MTPSVGSDIQTLQTPGALGLFNKAFEGRGPVDYAVPIITEEKVRV